MTVHVVPGFECPSPSHEVPVCLQNVLEFWPGKSCWHFPHTSTPGQPGGTQEDCTFCQMLHRRGPRITLKMHWRERTAANFCADACFWTVTKTPEDLSPSCLEVMWKLVYWQLSMRQPGFSKGSLLHRK